MDEQVDHAGRCFRTTEVWTVPVSRQAAGRSSGISPRARDVPDVPDVAPQATVSPD
jgi:hypothetical protein